ncbi:MAG: phosphotransferase [Bdellovibrionota bacterium]
MHTPGHPRDASSRMYYRATFADRNLIVMAMPVGEASSLAEEVTDKNTQSKEIPFVDIGRLLMHNHVHVPIIHRVDRELGLLLLEDFGDQLLVNEVQGQKTEHQIQWYEKSLQELLKLSSIPATGASVAFERTYNEFLYTWEFDHYLEYGLSESSSHNQNLLRELRAEFAKLTTMYLSWENVFCHRDFHSRNLIVTPDKRIGVIDFQDALLAPIYYDLASLLKDAYIELDRRVIETLLENFAKAWNRDRHVSVSPQEMIRNVDWISIQRNLKAFGRFFYIDKVKHNPRYLADTPRLAKYIRENFGRYPELSPLKTLLEPALLEVI